MKQVPEKFHADSIESAGIANWSNVKDIDRHVKALREKSCESCEIAKIHTLQIPTTLPHRTS
jgi:hypothetical protein